MKRMIMTTAAFLCIVMCSYIALSNSESTGTETGTVNITCAPDMLQLAGVWAAGFEKANPGVKVRIYKSATTDSPELLKPSTGLSLTSGTTGEAMNNGKIWKMVIGRDAIVPVICSKNPYFGLISQTGVNQEKLRNTISYPPNQNWSFMLQSDQSAPVHYYAVKDKVIQAAVKNFLSTGLEPVNAILVANSEELIKAIENDPLGLGFCKMANIIDDQNQDMLPNLKLLPVDKNGNGVLDYSERIYDSWATFLRGVWIGKYPQSLCRNIYVVAPALPVKSGEKAFLNWILTDGQQYLGQVGFCDLVTGDRQSKIDQINNGLIAADSTQVPQGKNAMTILAFVILTGLVVTAVYTVLRRRKTEDAGAEKHVDGAFDENSISAPEGIFFDKSHTWVFMEKNGLARIGVDDFLLHITGNITRLKMKNPEEKVRKGETIISLIHNGKQISVKSPVSGTIRSRNDLLEVDASIMNANPYADGWIYEISPTNWLQEIQMLLMAENYRQWIRAEFTRLKDFLAMTLKTNTAEYAPLVLQDGGALKDNVLSDLGPEVWEDFQTRFLDK